MEYEITQAELDSVLEASKPTPVMYLSGGQRMFDSPQANANRAWQKIAKRLNVELMTIRPSPRGELWITAEPKTK